MFSVPEAEITAMTRPRSDETAMRLIARMAAKFRPAADTTRLFETGRLKKFSLYGEDGEPDDDALDFGSPYSRR